LSTFTQLALRGSKNSFGGIYDQYSGVNIGMYDGAGNGGVYREANGRWYSYYNVSNDCMGIGTSTTSSAWNLYCNKGLYAGTRIDAPIMYDASNSAYYVDPASTGTSLNINGEISLPGVIRLRNGGSSGTATFISESYGINLHGAGIQPTQVKNSSFGVGITATGGNYGTGNGYFTGDVVAYYSDKRLKNNLSLINNAVDKVKSLNGYTYKHNELGQELLNENPNKVHAGLIAQEVQAVLPEVVTIAPFDFGGYDKEGVAISNSGENYLTIKYERLVPLLVEAIKEQQTQIEALTSEINTLKEMIK
jgi:hypothetical protein